MNLEGTADGASRFAAYVGELTSVIGHADRARPLRDYCAGLVVTEGRRSVEPIAAVTAPDEGSGAASKIAALRCRGTLVGRAGVGQSARAGCAGDRAARPDRGLDYRRYVFSKVRLQVGRRAASVLRAAREASQLSGGSDVVDGQSSCQPADRVQALSAAGMGKRRGPPQESTCSQYDHVQD